MWNDAHNAYLESRVMAADPLELVNLLYQACTASVRDARRFLEEGDIAARSRAVNRACAILAELSGSLDHERGSELSQRLESLYDYMVRRLVEANFQQADGPLAEVLGLLSTLGEAWDEVAKTVEPARPPEAQWPLPPAADEPVAAHAWSF